MIKKICTIEEVFDFVWELSQNDFYAGYPRKKPMAEIKDCIEKAINTDGETIIACYYKNVLCGVCIYHWDCEEKFAQTTQFLIRGDYDQIADEIIGYISEQLAGYDLFIPVPFTNKNANEYFNKKNIECVEAHIDTRLYNLKSHIKQSHSCIEKITKDTFKEYSIFHDKYAIPSEMYYHSKNLQKDIDRFRILVFRKDDTIRGSIFFKIAKDSNNIAEVFGLFLDEEFKNNGIESILINEMILELYNEFGETRELIYFVEEDNPYELNIVLNAGFEIKGRPRAYKCIL